LKHEGHEEHEGKPSRTALLRLFFVYFVYFVSFVFQSFPASAKAEDGERTALRRYHAAWTAYGETTMRISSLVAVTMLLASGFAAADTPPAPTSVALTREKAPTHAAVFIVSPKNGAQVGQDVLVKFGVKRIAVAPATDATPGTGHHHLLIDGKELPPLDAPIPNDATHKHYGKGQTEDTIHLEPGTHTLQLDFGDARHMQFDPPIVSRKITIHVK
jgi:hypothetical protein